MDKSMIVTMVNVAYCIIYIVIWAIRHHHYKANLTKLLQDHNKTGEYIGYSFAGLTIIPIIIISLLRNSYVFNNWLPISFIVQFIFQFIIMICFIIDNKVMRIVGSNGVMFFLAFGILNGLFLKDPKFNKLEMTQIEIQKLSTDIDEFSSDLSERMRKINEDMNSILVEIKEREDQINKINDLLKSKEEKHKQLSSIIEVDQEKADEILTALNIHPPTLMDRIIDGFIGALVALGLGYVWKRILLLKK